MIPKKKLTYIEQIEHLKQKGITFHYINEKEALRYLQKNNNFFKLSSYITRKKANWKMTAAMNRAGISSESINKKLANERLQQIITCFWAHKLIVSSEGVHHRISKLLHEWSKRLYRDYDYSFNNLLKSSFDVLSTLIDKWFSIV